MCVLFVSAFVQADSCAYLILHKSRIISHWHPPMYGREISVAMCIEFRACDKTSPLRSLMLRVETLPPSLI